VVSCQLHVTACFTFEETAHETHPVGGWVGNTLDMNNLILPAFHHYFDSSKTTALVFTTLIPGEVGTISGLGLKDSRLNCRQNQNIFLSS
jgi:hypothetical protein